MGGLDGRDVDVFAVSRDPRAHLWRKALFLLEHRPRRTIGDRARNVASIGRLSAADRRIASGLDEYDVRPRMRYVEHHPAHLASAAFVSPFDDAAVCAIDGFGDFVSTSWGRLDGSRLSRRRPRVLPAFARPAVSRRHAVPRLSRTTATSSR